MQKEQQLLKQNDYSLVNAFIVFKRCFYQNKNAKKTLINIDDVYTDSRLYRIINIYRNIQPKKLA